MRWLSSPPVSRKVVPPTCRTTRLVGDGGGGGVDGGVGGGVGGVGVDDFVVLVVGVLVLLVLWFWWRCCGCAAAAPVAVFFSGVIAVDVTSFFLFARSLFPSSSVALASEKKQIRLPFLPSDHPFEPAGFLRFGFCFFVAQ